MLVAPFFAAVPGPANKPWSEIFTARYDVANINHSVWIKTLNAQTLDQQFGIPSHVTITDGKADRPIIRIDNDAAVAEISLYGGQLLSYRAKHSEHDLMFVSDCAYYAEGKAIKGGIPICWPWFGDDPEQKGRGAHGFVRNRMWRLAETAQLDAKQTRIALTLSDNEDTRAIWPYRFALTMTFTIGETLSVALSTKNRDTTTMPVTQALHTYFSIGDIGVTRITGLDRRDYLDKVTGFERRTQSGDIGFDNEVDRIYLGTDKPVTIVDDAWKRQIHINADNSRTTVVWNPWASITAAMGDLADDDFRRFVCVETANAADEVIEIAAGADYTLAVEYRTEG